MTVAAINRFIRLFSDAFSELGVTVPLADIERMSMMVHSTMDQPRRSYHTSTHVFILCEGMNARQVLATLFHDLVYVQLDNGLPATVDMMLRRVVRQDPEAYALRQVDADDKALAMCVDVFGLAPGRPIPLFGGLNEFLSAVVAVRTLEAWLPCEELLAIVTCIEATVPFRGPKEDGEEMAQGLERRLRGHALQRGVELSEATVARMIDDAIEMSNRDVGNFAEDDPGNFLSSTWLLIEESNAPLAAVGVYAIREYRTALLRMESFLVSLQPEQVFHRSARVPAPERYAHMCRAARHNLDFSAHYLGAKLAAIAVVEALAQISGGDCPVSMFLGDIRSPFGRPDRVEDHLPDAVIGPAVHEPLLRVFEAGRNKESAHDLTASPLTAYVYRSLGHNGMTAALAQAKRMFAGQLSAVEFLQGLDSTMVRGVIHACSKLALSRRDALLAYAQTLPA